MITLLLLFLFFIAGQAYWLYRFRAQLRERREKLGARRRELEEEAEVISVKANLLEKEIGDYFLFYDLAKRLAALTNRRNLFDAFIGEIRYLGEAEWIEPPAPAQDDVYELKLGKNSSETLWIKTKAKKIVDYIPRLSELLGICVEKINLYEKLQQLAIYDFLTEVYNRRYFDLRFGEEFERAKNFNLNMSFLMIDVDDFKKINDTYGHLVGDAVLKETAALIKESVREIDFLARVGGEEFAAVLLDTDKGGAIVVGDRICVKIAGKLIKAFDEKLRVTVSVGIASFPQNTLYSDMLMETADKALYKAKREGKNRVGYF